MHYLLCVTVADVPGCVLYGSMALNNEVKDAHISFWSPGMDCMKISGGFALKNFNIFYEGCK